jgi:hypothetical protein
MLDTKLPMIDVSRQKYRKCRQFSNKIEQNTAEFVVSRMYI